MRTSGLVEYARRAVDGYGENARPLADPHLPVLAAYWAHGAEAALLLDAAGRVRDANPAAAALFPGGREGILGQHVAALLDRPAACCCPGAAVPDAAALVAGLNARRHRPAHWTVRGALAGPTVVPRAVDLPGRPDGHAALLLLSPAAPMVPGWTGAPAGDADPLGPAFEQIVRGTTEAVVAIDAAQRIVHFNRGAERLFGWTAEAVVGQPLGVLLPEAVREAHAAHVRAYVAGQGTVRWMNDRSDIAALKADGTVFPAEATILASGRPDAPVYAAVLRDVSARRETEARLRDHVDALKQARRAADMANRAKSEFLASMSHELRTPLNAIIGFAQLMTDALHGPLGAPQYAGYARDIQDSGEHLLQIVNDILDVSRIETGRIQLALDTVRVAALLESCRRLIAPRAMAGGLHLDVDPGPPGLTIEVDPRYLKQVLINLLANAVKFTPEAGRITLTAARTADGGVEIGVADSGVGIAADQLERIFEPFVQGDGSLARRFEGSGLGLSLVRSLIELHGGTASIDSAEGVGTTVRLTLPPTAVIDPGCPLDGPTP